MIDTVFSQYREQTMKPDLYCVVIKRGGTNVHARSKPNSEGLSWQNDSQVQRPSVILYYRMEAIEIILSGETK